MRELLAPTINLVILLSVLVYYLRAPLAGFVQSRYVTIGDEIRNVRDFLRRAQESYDEFSAKLKAIDVEITALRQRGVSEASGSRSRIVADAQRLAANIVADGKVAAQNAFGDLKSQLSSEMATQVLERAETLLRERLTGDDKVRIRREFSMQVENIQ